MSRINPSNINSQKLNDDNWFNNFYDSLDKEQRDRLLNYKTDDVIKDLVKLNGRGNYSSGSGLVADLRRLYCLRATGQEVPEGRPSSRTLDTDREEREVVRGELLNLPPGLRKRLPPDFIRKAQAEGLFEKHGTDAKAVRKIADEYIKSKGEVYDKESGRVKKVIMANNPRYRHIIEEMEKNPDSTLHLYFVIEQPTDVERYDTLSNLYRKSYEGKAGKDIPRKGQVPKLVSKTIKVEGKDGNIEEVTVTYAEVNGVKGYPSKRGGTTGSGEDISVAKASVKRNGKRVTFDLNETQLAKLEQRVADKEKEDIAGIKNDLGLA